MDFVTDEADLSVREFYHTYRKQLPKIVMVNQGFYDDTGNDTFSREQVLRLHKTTRRKRVLLQSFVGKVRKTYSMSINFPGKFCVETNDGQVSYDRTLLEVVRDHVLPVKVRLSRAQGTVDNSNHVTPNVYLDMDVKQTFDEISFLGNDIHQGVMSSDVIKVPLSDKLRFTIVTGIEGQSKRRWEEFTAKLTKETKGIDYSQEQGLEDIGQYNEEEVTPDTRFDRLEPVIYINLLLLKPGQNTLSHPEPKTLEAGYHEDVYEACGNLLNETAKTGRKSLMKNIAAEIAASLTKRGQAVKEAMTKTKPSLDEHVIVPKPLPTNELGVKPRTAPKIAPKPFPKPAVVQRKSTRTKEISKDPTSADGQDVAPVALTTTKNIPAKARSTRPRSHTARKVYDPEKDYDVALTDIRRKTCTTDVQDNAAGYYYDLTPGAVTDNAEHVGTPTNGQSTGIYTNTSQMAIISPRGGADDGIYMNQGQLNESKKRGRNRTSQVNTRAQTRTVSMTMKDHDVKNLSTEELTKLTVDEVGDYLRLLNIDGAVEAFRDERVDGRMLQQLNADLLKKEFNLTTLQILRLQNFVKDGHIPQ